MFDMHTNVRGSVHTVVGCAKLGYFDLPIVVGSGVKQCAILNFKF